MISFDELGRRIFHIFSGTFLGILFYYRFLDPIHFFVLSVFSVLLMNIHYYFKIQILCSLLDLMGREHEKEDNPGLGAVLFIIGITITVYLFPRHVSFVSILILSWGDPFGAFVGKMGRINYFDTDKKWEGVFSSIIVSFLVCFPFLSLGKSFLVPTFTFLLADLDMKLDGLSLDDNLVIPFLSACLITVL